MPTFTLELSTKITTCFSEECSQKNIFLKTINSAGIWLNSILPESPLKGLENSILDLVFKLNLLPVK